MGELLKGKKLLVTGVLTRQSIAFAIADTAQKEGADIVLTRFGRVRNSTEMSAKRLSPVPPILELDVNKPEDIEAVREDLDKRWGRLDGIVHRSALRHA